MEERSISRVVANVLGDVIVETLRNNGISATQAKVLEPMHPACGLLLLTLEGGEHLAVMIQPQDSDGPIHGYTPRLEQQH